jgi:hypothetical protein
MAIRIVQVDAFTNRAFAGNPAAVIAISLVPMIMVAIATLHGPGLTPDSVVYAASARSFAASGQFNSWDGLPVTRWPPGVALTLGLSVRAGVDLQAITVVLNILAAGAAVALAYKLGRQVLKSTSLALIAAFTLAISPWNLRVYQMLWSEPLFCTVSLAVLLLLGWMAQRGPTWSGALAVAVLVSYACLLRYIGAVLIPVTGLSVLVAAADRGVIRGLLLGAASALASAVGEFAVILRNLGLGAPAFGPRSDSTYSLPRAFADALSTIGHDLLVSAGLRTSIAAGVLLVGLTVAGAIVLARRTGRERRAGVPILLFAVFYFALLVYGEMTTNLDGINYRYMSPLYGVMAVLVVAGVQALLRVPAQVPRLAFRSGDGRLGSRLTVWAFRAATAALALVFFASNASNSLSVATKDASGVGYNARRVQVSQLAPVAAAYAGHLLTNDPVRLYWVTSRQPLVSCQSLWQTGDLVSAIRDEVGKRGMTYYAWFSDVSSTQGVAKADLAIAGLALHQIARYEDGILYQLTVGPEPGVRAMPPGGSGAVTCMSSRLGASDSNSKGNAAELNATVDPAPGIESAGWARTPLVRAAVITTPAYPIANLPHVTAMAASKQAGSAPT